jgi:hypothetical protein
VHDGHDALIRQAAELADRSLRACSAAAELKAQSEDLAWRLAETQRHSARLVQRLGERRAAPDPGLGDRGPPPSQHPPSRHPPSRHPPGEDDGPASIRSQTQAPAPGRNLHPAMGGTDVLGEDEAVTLAALLDELAARDRLDPLSGPASQAAALLRFRVAARRGQGPGSPAARREAGDARDDIADDRDAQAGQRDHSADERDDQARERDRRADDADQEAGASEQRARDLIWQAERRDKSAAEPPPSGRDALRQRELDREMAEAGRARNREVREAIRDMLAEAHAARQAAREGRNASGRDRLAGHRDRCAAQADRQDAARDRQAARADRDQAVIENEERHLPPGLA